jgi:hypothetical protein
VLQWTGEAWNDVELSLAMSRPDAELTLPELRLMVASRSVLGFAFPVECPVGTVVHRQ